MTNLSALDHFESEVLAAWRSLPCTRGRRLTPSDRALLRSLYLHGVSLSVIRAAFLLASARRSPDLPPVRSIAYFRTVFDELAAADPDYIDFLITHP